MILLEENEDGKTRQEIEYQFLGFIVDINELEDMADEIIEIEQWSFITNKHIKEKGSRAGNIRVRCVNGEKYILTIKSDLESKADEPSKCLETEQIITKEAFTAFKMLAPIGNHKFRYVFKVPNSDDKWEIDVMVNNDATLNNWCRIELETKSKIVPSLPVQIKYFTPSRKNTSVTKYIRKQLHKTNLRNMDSILPVMR